jgi:H/ACA ribonucleoprotein complex subunit 3
MMKCPKCKRYTLKEKCPADGTATVSAHPPVFSMTKETKYGKYRRAAAKE